MITSDDLASFSATTAHYAESVTFSVILSATLASLSKFIYTRRL